MARAIHLDIGQTMPSWDTLWVNATLVTCINGYGLIEDGAIALKDGKISWLGKSAELSQPIHELATKVHDMQGKCITPGLIDCHTHVIYAGNRADEFEMRLEGLTYEAIALRGGGIQSTVQKTRAATEDELFEQSLARIKVMLQNGVTTLEIKSGYGLDADTELKMLRVAHRIERTLPIRICKTFLGAHTFPPEYKQDRDQYVDFICEDLLPRVKQDNLAEAVDVFCEKIAFSRAQTERVFQTASDLGLAVKCHAEQLSDSDSASLAAQYKALSVDHLEYVSLKGIKAIAQSGSVAVLLPGAFYFLREKHLPPIAQLRKYNVPMAIATDCNPGSSPLLSLLMAMNMSCTLFQLSPEEALLGTTAHAARALGLQDTCGTLEIDKVADLAIWNIAHPNELSYYVGNQPLHQLIVGGK